MSYNLLPCKMIPIPLRPSSSNTIPLKPIGISSNTISSTASNSCTNASHNTLINMYKEEILTDCVFKVGNEKLNAHRCVLASNSLVFRRMFEQKDTLEAKNGEINIVDSSPKCVRALLDYFYNGEINKEILEKLVFELFVVAHKYEVKSLMVICEHMMVMKIDPKNFATCVDYSQLYNLPLLEKACIKYIASNRKTFLDSNEWKNLKELYKDRAFTLLEETLKNEF
ncbi:BTB domain-containing protein [Meloidogyne graminicola]|uniref:BTB domain-containing protein n=1 Tax=Meloidogyne graminicola TaxID=189291 RepID=A0A8S9ZUY6_9BILA|nr:BTB domain-containing protein [Meloidogyne graminicola]